VCPIRAEANVSPDSDAESRFDGGFNPIGTDRDDKGGEIKKFSIQIFLYFGLILLTKNRHRVKEGAHVHYEKLKFMVG